MNSWLSISSMFMKSFPLHYFLDSFIFSFLNISVVTTHKKIFMSATKSYSSPKGSEWGKFLISWNCLNYNHDNLNDKRMNNLDLFLKKFLQLFFNAHAKCIGINFGNPVIGIITWYCLTSVNVTFSKWWWSVRWFRWRSSSPSRGNRSPWYHIIVIVLKKKKHTIT